MIARTLAKFSLYGAIPCLLGFPLAVIAYRLNWLLLGPSFTLIMITFFSGLALLVLAMIMALIGMLKNDLETLKAGAIAFVLLSIPCIGLAVQAVKGKSVPRIHDISTDTADPPVFVAAVALRGEQSNTLDYQAEQLAAQQQQAYPYIKPIVTQMSAAQAFAKCLDIVNRMGWEIIAQDQQQGRIEAVDTTLIWGFKDDLVIRITPTDNGARIDLRSVSRVGISDLGANAARIKAFIDTF